MKKYAVLCRDDNTDFCRILFIDDRSTFYRIKLDCMVNHISCVLLVYDSKSDTYDSWTV